MLDRHTLSNAYLTCVVKADGAELCSLRDAVDQELLWQAGPAWPRHAPVLFPIVGRLMNDTLLHRGQTFRMTQHGFARDRRFAWLDRKATSCKLVLKDDAQTHGTYPFAFRLEVSFTLDDDALVFAATVINPGRETLPASVGAHPAFLWPISGDGDKSGHSIEFERPEPAPIRRLRDGLLLEERFPSPVEGQTLSLDPALFDADAIIIDRPASSSLRYTAPGSPRIEIGWEGATQLGLWSRRDGEFVCIEPWHGFASPVGFEGEFETKPGLMLIPPGDKRTLSYRVRVV
jgi:galactose mutarotase-like enzyme